MCAFTPLFSHCCAFLTTILYHVSLFALKTQLNSNPPWSIWGNTVHELHKSSPAPCIHLYSWSAVNQCSSDCTAYIKVHRCFIMFSNCAKQILIIIKQNGAIKLGFWFEFLIFLIPPQWQKIQHNRSTCLSIGMMDTKGTPRWADQWCVFGPGAHFASSTNLLLWIACINLGIIHLIALSVYTWINLMCRCISDLTHHHFSLPVDYQRLAARNLLQMFTFAS